MPQWRWVSWGAVAAAVLWVAGSALFSLYVSNFGNYNAAYGSLAAIVILMTWLLLGAYSILLGAEINAELERQTTQDTTVEEPEPMGRRGAYVADHVAGDHEDSPEGKRRDSPEARKRPAGRQYETSRGLSLAVLAILLGAAIVAAFPVARES